MTLMDPHHVYICLGRERAGQQEGTNKNPSKEEPEQLQAAVDLHAIEIGVGGALTRSDMGKRGDLIAQLAKSTGRSSRRICSPPPLVWSWWVPLWPSSPPFPHLPALLPVMAHYIGTK